MIMFFVLLVFVGLMVLVGLVYMFFFGIDVLDVGGNVLFYYVLVVLLFLFFMVNGVIL